MNPEAIATELRELQGSSIPIEVFDEITSTNDLLWQRYDEGASMPRVAIARRQTAGRGQHGHSWQSSEGGLYLSVLAPVDIDPQLAYSLTIASVWGIVDSLNQANIPVKIKWANDLLLQGKKLGGIKTETKLKAGTISTAVIGVGINYTNPVPDVGINLQTFWNGHLKKSGDRLAALVISGIINAIETLQQDSIEVIIPRYLDCLKNLGELVIYEGHLGQIAGINGKGELLLKMEAEGSSSTIKIPPGQISLGYPRK